MARIRTIKPEFPQSETIGALSRDARLLFIQLWTLADDSGRARAASRMLASLLYPYDDDAPKLIEAWLVELEKAECIRRYEVEGSRYLEILNWLKHQKIDKPSASKLPPFDEASRIVAKPREASPTDLVPGPGPGSVGEADASLGQQAARGGETKAELQREFVQIFWPAYPEKVAKRAALTAYVSARRRASRDVIMAGLAAYVAAKPPDRRWAHAASWLNADRWEDVHQPMPNPANANRGAQNGKSTLAALDRFIELDRQEREMLERERLAGHQAAPRLLSAG